MGLAKEWTDHKAIEDKKGFEDYIRNSGELLDRLMTMIDKRLKELDSSEDAEDYSSPAWAMKIASKQGRRKTLREIRKLLDRGTDD